MDELESHQSHSTAYQEEIKKQIQMSQAIAHSLTAEERNNKAKRMFEKRKHRLDLLDKHHHRGGSGQEGSMTSSMSSLVDNPIPRPLQNPMTDPRRNELIRGEPVDHQLTSEQQKLVNEKLMTTTGKAAKMYARQRERVEKYIVDDTNVRQPTNPVIPLSSRMVNPTRQDVEFARFATNPSGLQLVQSPWDAAANDPKGLPDAAFVTMSKQDNGASSLDMGHFKSMPRRAHKSGDSPSWMPENYNSGKYLAELDLSFYDRHLVAAPKTWKEFMDQKQKIGGYHHVGPKIPTPATNEGHGVQPAENHASTEVYTRHQEHIPTTHPRPAPSGRNLCRKAQNMFEPGYHGGSRATKYKEYIGYLANEDRSPKLIPRPIPGFPDQRYSYTY